MSDKYKPGTHLLFKGVDIIGTVVENPKLPGDIYVVWENGQESSYDVDFLDAHCKVVNEFGS
jgi:hypothetical protein